MADIFQFEDYRNYLKAKVKSLKNPWGIWAKIAGAAGCQATYLSQAIKGKVHLTPEHLLGISKYFNLTEAEEDFLFLLLEYAKAGTHPLKTRYLKRIQKIRSEREDIAKRFNQPRIEIGEKESLYYSGWFWSALHVIITIPEYQSIDAISKRLCIPRELVEHGLATLAQQGILKKEGTHWKLGHADLHIPKNSPMIGMHHMNWRQRAVNDSVIPGNDSVHFTAVYSMSRSDFQHLKEKMLEYIEHSRKVVGPSKEEELVSITCDIFKV